MYGLVKTQKTSGAERGLLMEYLQRSYPEPGALRVYSMNSASVMLKWGNVLCRKVQASAVDPEMRPVFMLLMDIVDTVADDNGWGFFFFVFSFDHCCD